MTQAGMTQNHLLPAGSGWCNLPCFGGHGEEPEEADRVHSLLPAAPSACALPSPRDALCRKGLGGFVRVAAPPPTPPCNFLPGEGEGAGITWCQAGKQCWEPSHSAQRLPDSLLTQAP